ncbi:hypothetical protein FKM82_029075, partial [Ascaphus truei]
QARDDILNGSHPVSFDKAGEFGGIQTQIQFGPHVELKHKPGFLDLKEFLPKEYIKQRGAEKKVFQEHKNCGEMTEIEAKVKYVKLARSLRTYGVSFFLVKVTYWGISSFKFCKTTAPYTGGLEIHLNRHVKCSLKSGSGGTSSVWEHVLNFHTWEDLL